MRMNSKVYTLADGVEPVEVQEFDGRRVEVFYLDDFDAVYNQNVSKGKFVVWTSLNGTDYRLFIEKGFYNEVHELYTQPINKIWLDFWDQCDDVTRKFNFRFLLPLAAVCLIVYLVLSFIPNIESWRLYPQIAIFAVFIIGMLLLNKFTKNKISQLNKDSVDLIKTELTPEGFEDVLARQKDYIENFFERKQQEIDDELAKEEAEDNTTAYADEDLEEKTSEKEETSTLETKDETVIENDTNQVASETSDNNEADVLTDNKE